MASLNKRCGNAAAYMRRAPVFSERKEPEPVTELKTETITMPSADFGEENTLPSVTESILARSDADLSGLSDSDGLFVNYGGVRYIYPYKTQDGYGRPLSEKKFTAAVLENEFLRAEFLPDFGGKLRSLFDKEKGRELLYVNSVARPCHLAVRNAWMSGGIEWNCGYVGHNPFTCDRMHTAETALPDGTPVLRFYQYERIRGTVYQIDCFLPSGSRFLYVRPRIYNPGSEVMPMYWWSNTAVPDDPGTRVIVPADETYTKRDNKVVKLPVPVYNKIDITYPANSVIAMDYFWNVPDGARKYIAVSDGGGYGLIQTSTRRLKGRKLFVWGKSAGGDRWKNFLTADNESGSYCEIQAGLAKTQYECLPMPPHTAWEWCEAYGAMRLDPANVHGDWGTARRAAEERLSEMLPERDLEALLESTEMTAKSNARVLFSADGWGALEERRRAAAGESAMCPHLDFGTPGAEQRPWVNLLENGAVGDIDPGRPPVSYIYGGRWEELLLKAVSSADAENWFAWFQLGLCSLADGRFADAADRLKRSVSICRTPWALYALSALNRDRGRPKSEARYMSEALELQPGDVSLAKAALRCFYDTGRRKTVISVYRALPPEIAAHPRCRLYYALALAETGSLEAAENILYENGGLILPDLREGETATLDLWYLIEEKKAKRDGKPFDRNSANPPAFADFRMHADTNWINGK